MRLSFIIILVGATLCFAHTSSNSFSPDQPKVSHLKPRDNNHYSKRHHEKYDIDDSHHFFEKRGINPPSLRKRSTKSDYDRAFRYMAKAKKSYQKAQRNSGNSGMRGRYRKPRPVNYIQEPVFRPSVRPYRQSPIYYNDNSRYDQLSGYSNGNNGDISRYDQLSGYNYGNNGGISRYDQLSGYNNGDNGEISRYDQTPYFNAGNNDNTLPPLPPTFRPPPSPLRVETPGNGDGQVGSDSEAKEWGLKDGKIPAGADIEEEDKPDPEQDPSDDTDPPIVDGKPVQREE